MKNYKKLYRAKRDHDYFSGSQPLDGLFVCFQISTSMEIDMWKESDLLEDIEVARVGIDRKDESLYIVKEGSYSHTEITNWCHELSSWLNKEAK